MCKVWPDNEAAFEVWLTEQIGPMESGLWAKVPNRGDAAYFTINRKALSKVPYSDWVEICLRYNPDLLLLDLNS